MNWNNNKKKKSPLHTPVKGIGSWWCLQTRGLLAPALEEVLVHLNEVSSLSLPRKHSTVGSGIILPVSGLPWKHHLHGLERIRKVGKLSSAYWKAHVRQKGDKTFWALPHPREMTPVVAGVLVLEIPVWWTSGKVCQCQAHPWYACTELLAGLQHHPSSNNLKIICMRHRAPNSLLFLLFTPQNHTLLALEALFFRTATSGANTEPQGVRQCLSSYISS